MWKTDLPSLNKMQEEISNYIKHCINNYNSKSVAPVVLKQQHKDTKKINPEHYVIDITYPPMVAEIFKRAYENKLDEIENIECDTAQEQKEKEEKLKQIEKEYETFLTFNP